MRTLVCLIILLLTVQAGNAILPNKFHFRHYNIENGISSNGISSIIQDRKGYIWIGTDNGISRFDGTQFVFYQKKIHAIRTCRETVSIPSAKSTTRKSG